MSKWYEIVDKSEDVGEISIYGYITDEKWYDEDVTPKDFKDAMDKLKNKKRVNLFINSGGGGVFAGMTIHNMIKRHPAEVVAHIDGIAASIASVIAMGANKIVMPKNSMMMIHDPSSFAFGNSGDMRKEADLLDKVKDAIVAAYSERTKVNEKEIRSMMTAETWMTGEEAVVFGFADELTEEKKVTASLNGDKAMINGIEVDLGKFKAFPKGCIKENRAEPKQPDPPAAPEPVNYSMYENELSLITQSIEEAGI